MIIFIGLIAYYINNTLNPNGIKLQNILIYINLGIVLIFRSRLLKNMIRSQETWNNSLLVSILWLDYGIPHVQNFEFTFDIMWPRNIQYFLKFFYASLRFETDIFEHESNHFNNLPTSPYLIAL